ncbi:hypothetical protein PHYBLDRAFT_118157, partial [Phycomyces blakesleeanus NRRL 1555(-)]
KTIKYGTAMTYFAAIMDMYQKQVKVGVNNYSHPRKACIQLLDNMKKVEFADLQTVMLDCEEPSKCPAFVLVLKQGKINQFGQIELAACLQNSKVEICPFIALGCYFFWK